jgi:hypothetical protein
MSGQWGVGSGESLLLQSEKAEEDRDISQKYSVASVHERRVPTERLVPTFCGQMVSSGQRDGPLKSCSRTSGPLDL